MKTQIFNKALKLISYSVHSDDSVFDQIMDCYCDVFNKLIDPFDDELNINLLEKETIPGKTDVIKYYIFKMWDIQKFFKRNIQFLFDNDLFNKYLSIERTEQGYTDIDFYKRYIFMSYEIFDYLMGKISTACEINRIDLDLICDELDFDFCIYDQGPALAIQNPKEQKDQLSEILKILEPIRIAFIDEDHIDKIAVALIEYSNNKIFPEKANRKVIRLKNKDFYPPFVSIVNNKLLTRNDIKNILPFFICNRRDYLEISPATVYQNLKDFNGS